MTFRSEKASKMSNVKVSSVHCTSVLKFLILNRSIETAEIMMNFVGDLKRTSLVLKLIILTLVADTVLCIPKMTILYRMMNIFSTFREVVKATAEKREVKLPFILMEHGISIITPAGITLYTVGGIKDIKNVRKYVSVDGGMGDNPRYILTNQSTRRLLRTTQMPNVPKSYSSR